MTAARALDRLKTLDGYRKHFMDAALWRPFVSAACRANGQECAQVRPGLAGTFPTFLVDERCVVKFFGPLFDGESCYRVEQEAAGIVAGMDLPTARLLAAGTLAEEPQWNYLIFAYIPGVSLGAVPDRLSLEARLALARQMGEWVRQMHRAALPTGTQLPRLTLEGMQAWFRARWPQERTKWPDHLRRAVPEYLERNAGWIQSDASHFIHADLTQDHLLGDLAGGRWQTRAVIDFGDAMLGNLTYDLVALQLDLFDCDRRLLRAFLESYGWQPDPDFVPKAMTTSLLHQFDVYAHLFAWKPALAKAETLEELAERIWNFDHRGEHEDLAG
jgi:hypothetical protein